MSAPEEGIAPPWPDLLIATGRQSVPYSLIIKRLSEGKTFTVQTQHPKISSNCFDLVVPPYHDLLAGPNVEPIIGAPHCVTQEKLSAEAKEVAPVLDALKADPSRGVDADSVFAQIRAHPAAKVKRSG